MVAGPDLNGDFGLRFPKSQILTSAHFLPRFISHCGRSVKKQVIRQTRRAHNPKSNYFSFCSLIQSKKRTPCGVLFALVGLQGLVCCASDLLAHPNALRFGTGLRTFPAADMSPAYLLFAVNPLRVRVPINKCTKQKNTQEGASLFGGPSGTRTRDRPVMSRML